MQLVILTRSVIFVNTYYLFSLTKNGEVIFMPAILYVTGAAVIVFGLLGAFFSIGKVPGVYLITGAVSAVVLGLVICALGEIVNLLRSIADRD